MNVSYFLQDINVANTVLRNRNFVSPVLKIIDQGNADNNLESPCILHMRYLLLWTLHGFQS
jgi:hypothetical protein